MSGYIYTMTKTSYDRSGSKWTPTTTETSVVEWEEWRRVVEAGPFFRRLGATDRSYRSWTLRGHIVTRVVSTSPDRSLRTVWELSIKHAKQ
jgi:hypothetical protein